MYRASFFCAACGEYLTVLSEASDSEIPSACPWCSSSDIHWVCKRVENLSDRTCSEIILDDVYAAHDPAYNKLLSSIPDE